MIECINLLILLTTCCLYYSFFYLIIIIINSEILDQLTILEKNVDSEVTKPKRGHKKKVDTKINELEDNDMRDKK